MSYNASIPNSTDRPSDSASQIKANFTALNTIFGEEHITYNAASNNGEHKKITFNDILAADPNLSDPKASLYTKTIAGDSQLFFENFDVGGAVNVIRQMTDLPVTTGVKHGGTEWSFLTPFGFRITMGLTAAFSGTSTDTFITPFTTVIYTSIATPSDPNPNPVAAVTTLTSLSLRTSNNIPVRYLVIGV